MQEFTGREELYIEHLERMDDQTLLEIVLFKDLAPDYRICNPLWAKRFDAVMERHKKLHQAREQIDRVVNPSIVDRYLSGILTEQSFVVARRIEFKEYGEWQVCRLEGILRDYIGCVIAPDKEVAKQYAIQCKITEFTSDDHVPIDRDSRSFDLTSVDIEVIPINEFPKDGLLDPALRHDFDPNDPSTYCWDL